MWWFKGKTWRTQTFVSYKILLKIRWKVQWRLHKQTSKTFQMHSEKSKFRALTYTNWHIDSLHLHFARCECPKLFTSRKINANGKTVKKNINTRFWISQCAQKSAAFGRKTKSWFFASISSNQYILSSSERLRAESTPSAPTLRKKNVAIGD